METISKGAVREVKRMRQIIVDRAERACVNCEWYEQFYRANRGNVPGAVGTSFGWCLKKDCGRGALRQPCKDFVQAE